MKINWILPEVSQSGGVRMVLEYANRLTALGHDVKCYAPQSGQHYGIKKLFFIKEIIRMKLNSDLRGEWFDNKFELEFPIWINNSSIRDADVTIATSWITSYWVNNLNPTKGKKVYFIQGFETWGNKRINKVVLKSYNLNFDRRITVSTALHDRLLKEAGSESVVICNGMEECFLEKKEKDESVITVGMPYRESENKNCDLGFRVLCRLKKNYPKIKIASFGFTKPNNLDKGIIFYENPSRAELVEFYNKTSILYVPSLYEGWGLPAMEAMGQECVVIAAKSGVIDEIGVNDLNCVILDNPRNEEETFIRLSSLIEDYQRISLIGKNARKAVSNMTISSSCNLLNELLHSITVE